MKFKLHTTALHNPVSASPSWHISCCSPAHLHFTPAASLPSTGASRHTWFSVPNEQVCSWFMNGDYLSSQSLPDVASVCQASGTRSRVENSPCAWERREEHAGRPGWNERRPEAWTKANAFEWGLIVEASWNTGCVVGRDKR